MYYTNCCDPAIHYCFKCGEWVEQTDRLVVSKGECWAASRTWFFPPCWLN